MTLDTEPAQVADRRPEVAARPDIPTLLTSGNRPIHLNGAGRKPDRHMIPVLGEPGLQIPGDNRAYILRRILAAADVIALLAAVALTSLISISLHRGPLDGETLAISLLLIPVWVVAGGLMGLYHLSDRRIDDSAADEIGPVALTATVWAWIFLMVRAAAASGAIGVLPSVSIWALTVVLVLLGRTLVRMIARHRPWYRQRVAVLGSPSDVAHVTRRLRRHPEFGLDVVRTLEVEDGRLLRTPLGLAATAHANGNGHHVNGNGHDANGYHLPDGTIDLDSAAERVPLDLEQLTAVATALSINRVIVATAPERLSERSALIRGLTQAGVHVDVVAGDPDAFASHAVLHYVEGLPVLTTPSVQASKAWAATKRAFDTTVAAATLAFLSPLLAYIAVRIKLDGPGPVLFRQPRVGLDHSSFELLKFRTMVADADTRKDEVSELNIHADSETPGMFKIPADPRVTKVGAPLRRWSLDELPQLWNVVRGDMSLVGPRPLIRDEASLVGEQYGERFGVRPGVTGPWQTLGRSDIGFEDMIKLDYTYVVNWSFAQDLRVLMRTAGAVSQGKGAY